MILAHKTRQSFHTPLSLLSSAMRSRIRAHFERERFNVESVGTDIAWQQTEELLRLPEPVSREEQLVLLLGIAVHLQPGFFEGVMTESLPEGGEFIEFGGTKTGQYRGMVPTGDTVLFLLAGMDADARLRARSLFSEEGKLAKYGLCHIETVKNGEPAMSGRLIVDDDWLDKVLLGKESAPVFSMEFPARRITTAMEWEDLVLHPRTYEQVRDIQLWMNYRDRVSQDAVLGRKVIPGYRVLFFGPSGTGKTLTATLLGKQFERPIYRIDLSQVVSKYIGETEKHIEWVFTRALRKNWILFFDEADALFGKRTSVQNAHDRFANQEVSYLLQRIEEYDGLLILASNIKSNIDDAFLRRFHNLIHFPIPGKEERLRLWHKCTPAQVEVEAKLDLEGMSAKYELTGAGILNVMHYAALRAYSREDGILRQRDVLEGIRREYAKQERTAPA